MKTLKRNKIFKLLYKKMLLLMCILVFHYSGLNHDVYPINADICDSVEITTNSASGSLLLTTLRINKEEKPFQNVIVKLRNNGYQGQIVSTATTDKNGFFHFPNVKPGLYSIIVETAGFRHFEFLVNIGKKQKRDKTKNIIKITVDTDMKVGCFGFQVSLTKEKL